MRKTFVRSLAIAFLIALAIPLNTKAADVDIFGHPEVTFQQAKLGNVELYYDTLSDIEWDAVYQSVELMPDNSNLENIVVVHGYTIYNVRIDGKLDDAWFMQGIVTGELWGQSRITQGTMIIQGEHLSKFPWLFLHELGHFDGYSILSSYARIRQQQNPDVTAEDIVAEIRELAKEYNPLGNYSMVVSVDEAQAELYAVVMADKLGWIQLGIHNEPSVEQITDRGLS